MRPKLKSEGEDDGSPAEVGSWGGIHEKGGVRQRHALGLKDGATGGFPQQEKGTSGGGSSHEARDNLNVTHGL